VGGRTLAHWEGEPEAAVRASQRWTVDIDIGEKDLELRGSAMPGGGNAAFRSDVFANGMRFATELGRVGNVLLSGEDSDLFRRMRLEGRTIWHCADAVVGHRISGERLTSAYLKKKHFWVGLSYAIIDRKLYGRFHQATRALARAAKLSLVEVPCWLVALVRRDAGNGLVARCRMAKQCGYVRGALLMTDVSAHVTATERRTENRLVPQIGESK
jgi:hypothetical protein